MPHRSSNGFDMVILVEQANNLCRRLGLETGVNLPSNIKDWKDGLNNGESERIMANAAAEKTKAGFAAMPKRFLRLIGWSQEGFGRSGLKK